jgi:uncharacterized membrane protein
MKTKLLYFMVLLVSLFSLVSLVAAHEGDDVYAHHCGMFTGMGGMMYGTYGSGMMTFGWLYSVLILVALILLIVWLVKQIQKK